MVPRNPGERRAKVHVPVRNVEREETVGAKTGQIHAHRLQGQQVQRNGVGTERVEDDDVVCRWRTLERSRASPMVTRHVEPHCSRNPKICGRGRDLLDDGVDFVKRPLIPGGGIGRQGTDTEPNDAYRERPPLNFRRKHLPDRALPVIEVRAPERSGERLPAVDSGAMKQCDEAVLLVSDTR